MTRREIIHNIVQTHPKIKLSTLKEWVRIDEDLPSTVEEWIDLTNRIRKDEGEWAINR